MKYFEKIVWTIALVLLFFMDTSSEAASVCVFKFAGFNSCWGCGIGHAVHHVLHLDFIQSLNEHILGIPATIGILYNMLKPIFSPKTTLNNGPRRTIYDVTGNSTR
jgi:hypothetical protein